MAPIIFQATGNMIPGKQFGFDYNYETNYRDLRKRFQQEIQAGADHDNFVLMPLVPFNPYEIDFREFRDKDGKKTLPSYAPKLEAAALSRPPTT